MNEFEEQVPMDYIDESVPAMVEQQGDFQDIEQSYQADGTVGADDNGSFLDEDVDIVTADGQEYPAEDGREGASKGRGKGIQVYGGIPNNVTRRTAPRGNQGGAGQPYNRGKGSYLQEPTPRYNSLGQVAGRAKTAGQNVINKATSAVGKAAGTAVNSTVGDAIQGAKGVGNTLKNTSLGSIGNAIKNNKGKAGIIAGVAAAGAGAAAYAKHKKDQENREGGRFGEGEFDETYEAPYTGEVEEQVVDYSDSVEANYASIQAAVNYAMQDNRL